MCFEIASTFSPGDYLFLMPDTNLVESCRTAALPDVSVYKILDVHIGEFDLVCM